jgi:hypothetical protein
MAKRFKYITTITLSGSDDKENIRNRIAFLTSLLNNSEEKRNHLDELRQKTMNYALLTFAGLFGFGLTLSTRFNSFYISIPLTLIMIIFCLLDGRLHKVGHGWQYSLRIFIEKMSEVINYPTKDITFLTYSVEGEKGAELLGFQRVIFYLLVLGGILSFFVF